jgi:hypothetical protein
MEDLMEKLDFTREQASYFKYYSLNDFTKGKQEQAAKELKRQEDFLDFYSEE